MKLGTFCKNVFAYTNHTILSEALEKWDISLFQPLLPRTYQIVEEINRRFMDELNARYNGDWQKSSICQLSEMVR